MFAFELIKSDVSLEDNFMILTSFSKSVNQETKYLKRFVVKFADGFRQILQASCELQVNVAINCSCQQFITHFYYAKKPLLLQLGNVRSNNFIKSFYDYTFFDGENFPFSFSLL